LHVDLIYMRMKTQKQAYHKPADEQKFTNLWATFKEIRLYFSNIYIPNLLNMQKVRQNWREEILNTKPSFLESLPFISGNMINNFPINP